MLVPYHVSLAIPLKLEGDPLTLYVVRYTAE